MKHKAPALHWLVLWRGHLVQWTPHTPLDDWRAGIHKIWYSGYVKWGD